MIGTEANRDRKFRKYLSVTPVEISQPDGNVRAVVWWGSRLAGHAAVDTVFFTQDKLDEDGWPVRDRASSSYMPPSSPPPRSGAWCGPRASDAAQTTSASSPHRRRRRLDLEPRRCHVPGPQGGMARRPPSPEYSWGVGVTGAA
jgi:hypothetical protein